MDEKNLEENIKNYLVDHLRIKLIEKQKNWPDENGEFGTYRYIHLVLNDKNNEEILVDWCEIP
jgi:hypothetical protein